MTSVRAPIVVTLLAALASGACATARAKAQPQPVALEVPQPPPRVVVPPEPEPPPSTPPVTEPDNARPQKPARRHAPAKPPADKAEPPRTDKKVETAPPVEAQKPAPPPTAVLQQQLPAAPSEMERQVRDQLTQATGDLWKVDYARLNADARAQYDTAKQFIAQAEQALKEKNLVFAAKVAEKAAGLAASLVGR
jgi:hypothetical protein